MSIQETILKIKGAEDLSRVILECLILAILLIISFIGWLFYYHNRVISIVIPVISAGPLSLEIPETPHPVGSANHPSASQSLGTSPYKGKDQNFVASKTGKVYYQSSCKASNRIKSKNRIYFATEQLAQAKHLTISKSCK